MYESRIKKKKNCAHYGWRTRLTCFILPTNCNCQHVGQKGDRLSPGISVEWFKSS